MGKSRSNKKKSQNKESSQKSKTRENDSQIEVGMQSRYEAEWGKEAFLKEGRKPPLKARKSKSALPKEGPSMPSVEVVEVVKESVGDEMLSQQCKTCLGYHENEEKCKELVKMETDCPKEGHPIKENGVPYGIPQEKSEQQEMPKEEQNSPSADEENSSSEHSSMPELEGLSLEVLEQSEQSASENFDIEGEAFKFIGPIIQLPKVDGHMPITGCYVRLNSQLYTWFAVIEAKNRNSYVTRRALKVEEELWGKQIPIVEPVLKGHHPVALLNIVMPDNSVIMKAPFIIKDQYSLYPHKERPQLLVGRNNLLGWGTRIEIGEYPAYDQAKICFSPMLGTGQTLMHNNMIFARDPCNDCGLIHSKPVSEVMKTKEGVRRNCNQELWKDRHYLQRAKEFYYHLFYSFQRIPHRNKCLHCTCPLAGRCRPTWTPSLSAEAEILGNGEQSDKGGSGNQDEIE